MKLESILKPFKKTDEEVLRWYTKKTKNIPDEKLAKYVVPMSIIGIPTLTLLSEFPLNNMGYLSLLDLGHSCRFCDEPEMFFRKSKEEALIPIVELTFKWNRAVRLPYLCFGVGLVAKNIYNLVDSTVNGTPGEFDYTQIIAGIGAISSASSMYLKDRDPKLLDRVSAWDKIYDSVKEKASELSPKPVPKPVTYQMRNYNEKK